MTINYKAILFGSIGTIVETSELQRRSFNQAFSEAGLDWNWTLEEYQRMLTKSGGRNRINDFANQRGIKVNADALHLRKTEIFDKMMSDEKISPRPGVTNLISYALDNGIHLAFVTSTSTANIDAMFFALNNQIKKVTLVSLAMTSLSLSQNPIQRFTSKLSLSLNLTQRIVLQ